MKIRNLILLLLFSTAGCSNPNKKQNISTQAQETTSEIKYAKDFTINRFGNYTQIIVKNPWDSSKVLDTYILVPRNKKLPTKLPEGTIIRIPVERVAFAASVHAGMWNQLNKAQLTVGVCEPEYFKIPIIMDGLKNGTIADLGMATAINVEKLIAASPEILVISPFENTKRTEFDKVKIAVVKDASYMEDSPLGRAEWIKFEAAFTCEDKLADKIFSKIEKNYNELCEKVAKTKNRPSVFTEKKFGDIWYIPGGKSYIGRFLQDAGANYIWKDLNQTGSVPLSFEKVYSKAIDADYWLLKYNNYQSDATYDELKNEYNLYAGFKAFKQKHIFAVNTGKVPFYEVGPLEPDVVLADLISIFHPEIMPNYKAKYYLELK